MEGVLDLLYTAAIPSRTPTHLIALFAPREQSGMNVDGEKGNREKKSRLLCSLSQPLATSKTRKRKHNSRAPCPPVAPLGLAIRLLPCFFAFFCVLLFPIGQSPLRLSLSIALHRSLALSSPHGSTAALAGRAAATAGCSSGPLEQWSLSRICPLRAAGSRQLLTNACGRWGS